MKDSRDDNDNTEWRGTGMGNQGTRYYKGTNIPVPEKKVDKESGWTYYEGPGVCSLCGRYTCNGSCFK